MRASRVPRVPRRCTINPLTSFLHPTHRADIGWRVREDSGRLLASLLYIAYGAFFLNEVKKQYLPAWVPSLQEDKRRSYIIDRSSSVVLWILAIFSCIECISAFLKVPLSSTLAFGGIGGLAFGLASKDVVSNFFGGASSSTLPWSFGRVDSCLYGTIHGPWHGVHPTATQPNQSTHTPQHPHIYRADAPLHRALHPGGHGLLHHSRDALRGEGGARWVVPDAAPRAGHAVRFGVVGWCCGGCWVVWVGEWAAERSWSCHDTHTHTHTHRPTYVPNSVFVDTMVTNMDRITHRRFEASFSLRYQVRLPTDLATRFPPPVVGRRLTQILTHTPRHNHKTHNPKQNRTSRPSPR